MTTPHNPSTDQLLRDHLIRERKSAQTKSRVLRLLLFFGFCAVMLAIIIVVLVLVFRYQSCVTGWSC